MAQFVYDILLKICYQSSLKINYINVQIKGKIEDICVLSW